MLPRGLSRYTPYLIAAVLVILLAVLATLQHRWIGQVSMMQRHRMQASLNASGSRFTEDFDREMTRAWIYFSPVPREVEGRSGGALERTAQQWEQWKEEAPYPGLVRDIFYLNWNAAGGFNVEVLRPGAREFEPVSWPADLEPLRRLWHAPGHDRGAPVAAEIPALLVPVRWPHPPPHTGEHLPGGILIVRLDPRVIAGEILPDLYQRHFADSDYSVAVLSSEKPGRVIFQSDPGAPLAALRSGGDANLPMFGLRSFQDLHRLWRTPHTFRPRGGEPRARGGAWRLVMLRRHGTLEHAVLHFRMKNLAVSAGILVLLAVVTGMMVVTTQRAQKLARQQIELVAGVTHELNTPITAIRSAGQNLADGVVADPAQVRRYGALVEGEGRRLSRMVAQMLDLAGLQSGQEIYTLQPTPLEEVLDEAIEDCRWLLDERQAQVEKDIAPDLPAVLGDAGTLRRALRNLLENAAKYGGSNPWIGVRARATGPEITVTVEDRGPGIRREDLPHLFEPFYRGREVKTGGIPGSGLGLSVVRRIAEAHRGRVTVAAGASGQGSAFTLHLPAA